MSFRAALSVGIIVAGEAEIGKGAIGKRIGGRGRCDRHGDRRLLDQSRYDENERTKHTRRQVRQPISQISSCQNAPKNRLRQLKTNGWKDKPTMSRMAHQKISCVISAAPASVLLRACRKTGHGNDGRSSTC